MTGRRKILLCLALALPAALLIAAAAWFAAPWFAEDSLELLGAVTPARKYFDCNGTLLWEQRPADGRRQIPVALTAISPEAIQVTLAAEDANFFQHGGVDYAAALRALRQNIRHGRVVSGASTISMQLAGMSLPRKRHSLLRKFRQAARARALERRYPKTRILEEYLNRAPYGGNLYGIEAAAQYYFGHAAATLDTAESALLCGLPQRPNRYRPDRYPERARARRERVLLQMTRHELLSDAERKLLAERRTPLRDFSAGSPFAETARLSPLFHAMELAAKEDRESAAIHCSLDAELSGRILAILRRHAGALAGVKDAAAIVIDNRTGEVPVLIGTLDYRNPLDGEINAAAAIRSAGSTLKPFLYAEAMAGGLLVADTVLEDAPLRYGSYAPGNFDGAFRGRVTAAAALSQSLNTPVIRLLAQLGEARVLERFAALGLRPPAREPGLSLALGSAGYSLIELANGYRTLANDGMASPLHFLAARKSEAESRRVYPESVCRMISEMLRSRALPGTELRVAWKTGTSNNNCDAWCFVYTPDHTLGVWFGNKSGARADSLTGADAAVPAAAELVNLLYRARLPAPWPESGETELPKALCAASGLAASFACEKRETHPVLRDVPLRRCTVCGAAARDLPKILSPAPRTYRAGSSGTVRLPLTADRPGMTFYWGGRVLGSVAEYDFPPGRHTLYAVSGDPALPSAQVSFSVEE